MGCIHYREFPQPLIDAQGRFTHGTAWSRYVPLQPHGAIALSRPVYNDLRPFAGGYHPDVYHHDVDKSAADGGCSAERERSPTSVTILAYPHEEWEPWWGGATEFAATDCTTKTDASEPPVLRVAPLPGRTVVFAEPLSEKPRSRWRRRGFSESGSAPSFYCAAGGPPS